MAHRNQAQRAWGRRQISSRSPGNLSQDELAAQALEQFRVSGAGGLSTHQLQLAHRLAGAHTPEGARIARALAHRGV